MVNITKFLKLSCFAFYAFYFASQSFAQDCPLFLTERSNHYQIRPTTCGDDSHKTARVFVSGNEVGRFATECGSNGSFKFENVQGEKVGSANIQTFFPSGEHMQIKDCDGEILYTVTTDLNRNISGLKIPGVSNVYRGDSESDQDWLGYCRGAQFYGLNLEFFNPGGTKVTVARLGVGSQKGATVCVDPTWSVNVFGDDDISDPRIVSFMIGRKALLDLKGSDHCTGYAIGTIIGGLGLVVSVGLFGTFIYQVYHYDTPPYVQL